MDGGWGLMDGCSVLFVRRGGRRIRGEGGKV